MFEPGEFIHHASNGLCKVEEITKLDIPGADQNRLYYRLTLLGGTGGTVYTPVDHPKVQMRRALTREEADRLIDEMPEIDLVNITEEKRRESIYREALSSADCKDWVSLIKTLYARRRDRLAEGKKVTATEERYYQLALTRLNTEIAMAMKIGAGEVEEYICARLEKDLEK